MANDQSSVSGLIFREDIVIRFKLGHVEFVALPGTEHKRLPLPHDKCTLTVIPTSPQHIYTRSDVSDWLDKLEDQDDVSHAEFRKRLLFCGSSHGTIQLGRDLLDWLKRMRTPFLVVELVRSLDQPPNNIKGFVTEPVRGGPYLWDGRRLRLRRVCRLYEDDHSAFLQALYPVSKNVYKPLLMAGDALLTFCAAVSTRHRCPLLHNAVGSLVGKRILVKDIFEMEGLKISACNQDYLRLSPTSSKTAPLLQRLIDKGAVIVGKARLSSMISREEPSEVLDYPPPMNPRGDGKQSPAGSSSGSAAGVAAYAWIDFAIGSDSTGSARRPAMANGVYALRITTNVLPSAGMMPCFPIFDTPAVFTRHLKCLKSFVDLWCAPELDNTFIPPSSIIVPTDFRVKNERQIGLLHHFITSFAQCFNIPIRRVSLKHTWTDSPPPDSGGLRLEDYLAGVGRDSFFYDFYDTTREFRTRWQQRKGKEGRPKVNLVTGWRWDEAERISKEQRDIAVHRLDVYKDWLRKEIFYDANPIMVLPIHNAEECYRDEPPKAKYPLQQALDQLWLAPILGAPELTVPIGQVPYFSRISRRKEWLPVVASLLGKPKTDLSLIDTATRALEHADIPTHVAAGKQMWEPGWEFLELTPSPSLDHASRDTQPIPPQQLPPPVQQAVSGRTTTSGRRWLKVSSSSRS